VAQIDETAAEFVALPAYASDREPLTRVRQKLVSLK
jgi:hypothetical protein